MAKKPTIGDILAEGKKQAIKIRKQSISKARKVSDRLPIKGPIGLGVDIAEFASLVSQELVNQASDIAFRDVSNINLPSNLKIDSARTILPNVNQIEKTVRPRSDKQLVNDQIMRVAMKNANARGRKKNGQLKKGMTQKRIMKMAQLECTKERQRLGLCKKKGTRKGMRRKTARRAFEK